MTRELKEKSLVERAFDIPEKYRRDICSGCGEVIPFFKHKVTIGPYTHFLGLSGDDANDVTYTDGFWIC